MNHLGTMRTPAVGVVPAHGTVVVTVEKPLDDHEQPVVITPQTFAVHVTATYRTKIILQNDTNRPAPYVLVIVPRRLIAMGLLPWRQLYALLQQPDKRSALFQRAARALVAALANVRTPPTIEPGDE